MPGSQTTRGQTGTRSSARGRVAFRFNDSVGTPEKVTFVARWLAYTYPCQRFARCLTTPPHDLGTVWFATPSLSGVGIEVQRAPHRRVRWFIHQFPDGPQSGSHDTHVSTSPPFHPGRRDFPDPVGDVTFPAKPSHSGRRLKHWPAYLDAPRVCFVARHARLRRRSPATVCRLRCAACPSLPRAPLLRRHYPPSSLIWAHARILWPLSSFGLRPALESPCRLGQPRLVHRTVPALMSALSESVAPPTPRVRSVHLTVSSRATAAFAMRVPARHPLLIPQHGFMRGKDFGAAGIP
jgi:hypothetical protein